MPLCCRLYALLLRDLFQKTWQIKNRQGLGFRAHLFGHVSIGLAYNGVGVGVGVTVGVGVGVGITRMM